MGLPYLAEKVTFTSVSYLRASPDPQPSPPLHPCASPCVPLLTTRGFKTKKYGYLAWGDRGAQRVRLSVPEWGSDVTSAFVCHRGVFLGGVKISVFPMKKNCKQV